MKITKAQLVTEARRVFGDECHVSIDWPGTAEWGCKVQVDSGVAFMAVGAHRNTARRRLYEVLRRLSAKEVE